MPAGLFDPTFDPEAQPLDLPAPAKKADKWKQLAPLLAALPLAIRGGGRVGAAALLQGFQQTQQQLAQDARQASIDDENREYRQATLQHQRGQLAASEQAKRDAAANAETQRRQQFLTQFGTGLESLDTPEAVQAYLALQQAQGRTIGVNGDELARMVPNAEVLKSKRIQKRLAQIKKDYPDAWQSLSFRDGEQVIRTVDADGVIGDVTAKPKSKDLSGSGLDVQLIDAKRRAAAGDPNAAAEVKLIEDTISRADSLRRDPQRQPIVVTVGNSGLTAPQLAEAGRLRDDYRAQSKDFFSVRDAFERVQAAQANPSPAGDVALLYAYMKLLDPGSVVRETEFATAAKTGSLPQQIQATATRVLSGERLTPQQRADFVARAKGLYDKAQNRQNKRVAQFRTLASTSGVPEQLVIVDDAVAETEPATPFAAPQAPARTNPFRR